MLASEHQCRMSWPTVLAISLVYTLLLLVFSSYHEHWRDEVRALSISLEAHSLRELYALLRNEGHPGLWYVLLGVSSKVVGPTLALKAASIVIATASAVVFLRFAPLALPIKLLWLLGYYPLYEYSVVCRNYGLGMLLLFSFCAVYPQRLGRPFPLAVILCLLAHSSFYGLILAVALGASLIFEQLLVKAYSSARLPILAVSLWLIGCLSAFFQMMPDASSIVVSQQSLNLRRIIEAATMAVFSHGSFAHNAFSSPFIWTVPLLVFGLYAANIRKPSIALFLFLVVLGIELLNRTAYSALALRHQGFLVLAVLAAIWLDFVSAPQILKGWNLADSLEGRRRQILSAALIIVLLPQLVMAHRAVSRDLRETMSNAAQVGDFIRSRPALKQAVIFAEPDYVLDTLPAYLSNPLFLVREKSFGKWVSFTDRAMKSVSLSDLLEQARQICEREGKAVLLLLPNDLQGSGKIQMMYGKEFVFSEAELQQLNESADTLQQFDGSLSAEDYTLFQLKGCPPV